MRKNYYRILSFFSVFPKFILRDRVRILAFHDVKDKTKFEKLINYLNRNYNVISMEDFKRHVLENVPLPKYSLLITFDDGDISVLENGLPVLKKYNCPATVFIITDYINKNIDFWFKNIRNEESVRNKNGFEIESLMKQLKELPNKNRLEYIKNYKNNFKRQLTVQELKKMEREKIFLANHTHTHPMINRCNVEEIESELLNSKAFFDSYDISGGYEIFAYPNGNYDAESENVLRENGINLAFLFDHKICKKEIHPYRISRLRVNSDLDISEIKVKVSGLHSVFLN
jgi:peptidoglycan/xylan/chitin deacetylase (PgdA/CDA1 family)